MCLGYVQQQHLAFSVSVHTHMIDLRGVLSIQNQNSVIDNDIDYRQYEVDDKIRNNDNSNDDSQVSVFGHLHGVGVQST